jgi:TspO/MBR family
MPLLAASMLVAQARGRDGQRPLFVLFGTNLALNLAWTLIFFRGRSPLAQAWRSSPWRELRRARRAGMARVPPRGAASPALRALGRFRHGADLGDLGAQLTRRPTGATGPDQSPRTKLTAQHVLRNRSVTAVGHFRWTCIGRGGKHAHELVGVAVGSGDRFRELAAVHGCPLAPQPVGGRPLNASSSKTSPRCHRGWRESPIDEPVHRAQLIKELAQRVDHLLLATGRDSHMSMITDSRSWGDIAALPL